MSWYELMLLAHVAAAVVWLGGAFTFQMYGWVVRRGGDPEETARFAGRAGLLGERMFVPRRSSSSSPGSGSCSTGAGSGGSCG